MSYNNWLFVAEIDHVDATNIAIQLIDTAQRHPRQRAMCTYALASELEYIAHHDEATWTMVVDPTQGRLAITLANRESTLAAMVHLTAALIASGIPMKAQRHGN
jgi:hypothetical protein